VGFDTVAVSANLTRLFIKANNRGMASELVGWKLLLCSCGQCVLRQMLLEWLRAQGLGLLLDRAAC
jgi:hypothetical protein